MTHQDVDQGEFGTDASVQRPDCGEGLQSLHVLSEECLDLSEEHHPMNAGGYVAGEGTSFHRQLVMPDPLAELALEKKTPSKELLARRPDGGLPRAREPRVAFPRRRQLARVEVEVAGHPDRRDVFGVAGENRLHLPAGLLWLPGLAEGLRQEKSGFVIGRMRR